jgi:heme/copper-type cytochrome/quinol oxidase subunit 2
MEVAAGDMLHTAADKSHIPFWGILLILLVIILVIFVAFYFCLAKYWRKFKESDKGQRFKGLDLKSVNLIGQMGKEKACFLIQSFRRTHSMTPLLCMSAILILEMYFSLLCKRKRGAIIRESA